MEKIIVKYISPRTAATRPITIELLPTKEAIEKALGGTVKSVDLSKNLRLYYRDDGEINGMASCLLWEFLGYTRVIYGGAIVSGSLGEFPDSLPDWMR